MKNTWRTHEEVKVDWSVERHVKCRSEEDPVRNYLADYIRGRDTLKGYRQTLVLAGHS